MALKLDQLILYLTEHLPLLKGEQLVQKNAYENGLCQTLGLECQNKTYWDCVFRPSSVASKKSEEDSDLEESEPDEPEKMEPLTSEELKIDGPKVKKTDEISEEITVEESEEELEEESEDEIIRIELKKADRSFWVPLVRYAQIILGQDEESTLPTVHLFFDTRRKKVNGVMTVRLHKAHLIRTSTLLKLLNISVDEAQMLINLNKSAKDRLEGAIHCQLRLKATVVEKHADYTWELTESNEPKKTN